MIYKNYTPNFKLVFSDQSFLVSWDNQLNVGNVMLWYVHTKIMCHVIFEVGTKNWVNINNSFRCYLI